MTVLKLIPPAKDSLFEKLFAAANEPDPLPGTPEYAVWKAELDRIGREMTTGMLYGNHHTGKGWYLDFEDTTLSDIESDCQEYPHLAEDLRKEFWLYKKFGPQYSES